MKRLQRFLIEFSTLILTFTVRHIEIPVKHVSLSETSDPSLSVSPREQQYRGAVIISKLNKMLTRQEIFLNFSSPEPMISDTFNQICAELLHDVLFRHIRC